MTKDATLPVAIPYEVTFKRAGATTAQDLGLTTQDGVTMSYDPHLVKKLTDQYGMTPVDVFCAGIEVSLTFNLLQWDIDVIKHIMIASYKKTDTGIEKLEFGEIPGRSLKASKAGELIFHRFGDAATVKTYNIQIHQAICTSPLEIVNNSQNLTVFPATFEALIDTTKQNGNLIGTFGDPDASVSAS